ncbi:MAG: hypothetical protein JXR63_05050 [Spirochaetales bacterium]|nr:hypothetical protein [Spirochaetales bacterium]
MKKSIIFTVILSVFLFTCTTEEILMNDISKSPVGDNFSGGIIADIPSQKVSDSIETLLCRMPFSVSRKSQAYLL